MLTPDKLAELEARIAAEQQRREEAAIAAGAAVRIVAMQLDGETVEEARERALAHHGALPEGAVPIYDVVRIITGIEPSEKTATSAHEPKPYDYDNPREPERHDITNSPASTLGPPPKRVLSDDGHEGFYLLGNDGLLTLTDAMGRPLGDEWRSRIALTDDPDHVARALLRQRPCRDWDPFSDQPVDPGGGFNRRRLAYPDGGWR